MHKTATFLIAILTCGAQLSAGVYGFPTLDRFETRANQYGVRLTIPDYPSSTEEIEAATPLFIEALNRAGDEIANLPDDALGFTNTFRALDWATQAYYNRVLPFEIVNNTFKDPALRTAAGDALKALYDAGIAFGYREDIYLKLKAYADTDPILPSEDLRLLQQSMRSYERMGFNLPKEQREAVEALQKELSNLEIAFSDSIREDDSTLVFTEAQLPGVPSAFLDSIRNVEGQYEVKPGISHHAVVIMQNCSLEPTRKELMAARNNIASVANLPTLSRMVAIRTELAKLLGYDTWADFKTADRMAGSGDRVQHFLEDLIERLEPKFQMEIAALTDLKQKHTGEDDTQIHAWDVRFYEEMQNQQQFDLDSEKIKRFFPYEKCVRGLFHVYEILFGITITEIENPTLWDEEVALYVVSDTESERPLGLFYLDPFPREGKFNHFAQFSITTGGALPDGSYQAPTVALICNFPPADGDGPSLLPFRDVETLFHEFGHGMHSILSEAQHNRFWGTSVPLDFVEVPSQVMEYWLKDKRVLDLFAADWQDQSLLLPHEWVDRMKQSILANRGMFYRRQLSFGLLDIALHHQKDPSSNPIDLVAWSNDIAARAYLPFPENTSFITGFGHLAGYDAGYYGYAWADIMAADVASVFIESDDGFMDESLGMRLRKEIFAPGNSRDVNESIRAFLGREPNMDAFIRSLGIAPAVESVDEEI